MNKVILVGTLSHDPELRHTAAGVPYCAFTLACAKPVRRGEETAACDHVPCRVYGREAEALARGAVSGQQVVVEGRIAVTSREIDGQRHWFTRVNAQRVERDTSPQNGALLWLDEVPFDV